jgi:2-keto-3-deoxy-6-phosphogluconate aldolase
VFAVGGSWLAGKQQIADGQWSAITRQTREALARASEVAP